MYEGVWKARAVLYCCFRMYSTALVLYQFISIIYKTKTCIYWTKTHINSQVHYIIRTRRYMKPIYLYIDSVLLCLYWKLYWMKPVCSNMNSHFNIYNQLPLYTANLRIYKYIFELYLTNVLIFKTELDIHKSNSPYVEWEYHYII